MHLHALVLDGVSTGGPDRPRSFALPLTTADVADVLATVVPRLDAWQRRRSASDDDAGVVDAWTEDAPTLAGLGGASVQGVAALGPGAGTRPRRLGRTAVAPDLPMLADCQARQDGFEKGRIVPPPR